MRFGGVKAVDGVNFRLAEGELRCLIGPNGAGKSTFFKLLTGSSAHRRHGPVRGRDDRRHGTAPDRAARRRHQDAGAQRVQRADGAGEHLAVARRVNSAVQSPRSCDEMLERVGMTALADRQVGQLAHGQRQWVELGMVLATEPDLVLLDEPAAGMTDDEVEQTAELISRSTALRADRGRARHAVHPHDREDGDRVPPGPGPDRRQGRKPSWRTSGCATSTSASRWRGRHDAGSRGSAFRLRPHPDPEGDRFQRRPGRVHRHPRATTAWARAP